MRFSFDCRLGLSICERLTILRTHLGVLDFQVFLTESLVQVTSQILFSVHYFGSIISVHIAVLLDRLLINHIIYIY